MVLGAVAWRGSGGDSRRQKPGTPVLPALCLPSSWAPGTLGSAHPWHPGPTGFTWLKFQPAVGEEAGADTLHFPISGNKSCGAIYCQVEKKPIAKPCVKKQQHLGALLPLGENIPGNAGAGNKGPFLCLRRGLQGGAVALESESP